VKASSARIFSLLIIGTLLVTAGLAAFAAHMRAPAKALIDSASRIRSTADAEHQIAVWRARADRSFWHEGAAQGGDYTYDVQVENGLLPRLHIAAPTMVGMTIGMHNRELRYVILVMFTGREPSTTSGVWVQEWFGTDAVGVLHVNDKDKPLKATVDFRFDIPEAQRSNAFSLNATCFVEIGGCKTAEEILPGVWQLTALARQHP
jgi:hypothetical protein